MQNIFLSPHFSQMEFTESPTAKKYGIDNTPTPTVVNNLRNLCVNTIEPLREELQLPVIITSGYRAKALNDILSHSSHKSQHLQGLACDFYVGWNKSLDSRGQSGACGLNARERLIKAFRLILTSEKIDYDQLILYPNFIHVSFVSHESNRHYIMKAEGNGRYARISKEVALSLI